MHSFKTYSFAAALVVSSTAHSRSLPSALINNGHEAQHQIFLPPTESRKLNANDNIAAQPYVCHTTFPPSASWLPFETLWCVNAEQILSSNGGDTYITHYIQSALLSTGFIYRLDPRLLLASMMEASRGKASAPCACPADGGECVCGIMQVPHGGSFNEKDAEKSVNCMIGAGGDALMHAMKTEGLKSDALLLAGESRMRDVLRRFEKVAGKGKGKGEEMGRFEMYLVNRLMGWNGRGKGSDGCL
ncbi:unnamed protein product [Zymoseptoria tritici ST99CH_1E4]|uniref:Uncharacterized protein n=1 Tax=Zymoseptoria tritici ST99CH_1E4 TaxID=1276532 RepID=A0A2H1GBI8_ZYMTR|nr:unnamed protein product [Zymoseptoria tritici ST99CH_1E4]